MLAYKAYQEKDMDEAAAQLQKVYVSSLSESASGIYSIISNETGATGIVDDEAASDEGQVMGTARMKTARILPVMMTMEIMMRIIRTMGVTGIQVRNSTGVGETKEKPPNRGCCQMTAAFFVGKLKRVCSLCSVIGKILKNWE